MNRQNHQGEPLKDLHIVLTESQHHKIKLRALEAGVTISSYCIRMIFKGTITARFSPIELKLLRDVSNVANNTNQIAKRLNSLEADKITIAMAENAVATLNSLLSQVTVQEKSAIEQ